MESINESQGKLKLAHNLVIFSITLGIKIMNENKYQQAIILIRQHYSLFDFKLAVMSTLACSLAVDVGAF